MVKKGDFEFLTLQVRQREVLAEGPGRDQGRGFYGGGPALQQWSWWWCSKCRSRKEITHYAATGEEEAVSGWSGQLPRRLQEEQGPGDVNLG